MGQKKSEKFIPPMESSQPSSLLAKSVKLKWAQQVTQVLCDIADGVNTTLDLDELYQAIHRSLGSIIDVTNFFICIVNLKEKTLYFPYFVDVVDDDFTPITDFDTSDSLAGLVVLERQPLLLDAYQLNERAKTQGVWGPMPKIWLGVPLIIRDEVIGVMAVQSYTNPDQFDEEDVQLLSAISHQIAIAIDRKQSLDELKRSEEKYRNIFHNAMVGLFQTSATTKVVHECNEAMAHILGYEDQDDFKVNFKIPQAYVNPDDRRQLMRLLLKEGVVENVEVNCYKKGGDIGWLRVSLKYDEESLLIDGVAVDITEMKLAHEKNIELERKLERAKKMEALGLLAGGVAHDLNNILAGIINYPELMLIKLPSDSELRKPVQTIRDAGKRAALIVADMLTIARSAASNMENQNIHDVIEDFLDSPECLEIKKTHPGIVVSTDFSAVHQVVYCSRVHINKCLMNLVSNGMEAISGQGEIVIRTANKTAADVAHKQANLTVEHLLLEVRDSGSGIAEKDLEHIFEPFYTKKVMGRSGTGLGLTIVWNTMRDHGGAVAIDNHVDGTSFILSFPHVETEIVQVQHEETQVLQRGKGESILIVDDEEQLRDIARRLLLELGYVVYTAESGESALEFLTKSKVDLMLLDMLMEPGMDGLETYEKVIALYPGQKAIVVSGFSDSKSIKAALKLGVGRFINKPYSLEQLSLAVIEVLSK